MSITAFKFGALPDEGNENKPVERVEGNRTRIEAHRLGLLSEESFVELLALERKRSERSQRPFMVMLADMENVAEPEFVVPELVNALSSSTRDTDITGWYSTGSVIGTIFTEVRDLENGTMGKMQEKISSALHERLGPDFEKIQLSFYRFPEEWDRQKPGRGNTARLYPDVVDKHESRKGSLFLKRAMDIAGSAFALLLFSPLFLVISLIIKWTSKGPVFFRQERAGQYGVLFPFLKFRTMHVNNDARIHQEYVSKLIRGQADGQAASGVYKITNDPRVTRFGSFLRKTSLDELPQFLNVLMGEMSLVGPRPPIPYELEAYDLWHRRRILEAKPGITGLWQVRGRSRTTFDEMVRLDLRYARTWSLWLDLQILLATPRAVFSRKGAY